MVAQVAITGSGSTSVSPAQNSASAGSSFTDLLQSMVKPASTRSSCATSSPSVGSTSKAAQSGRPDVSADRSADQQQKVSETPAEKEEVATPAKAEPRAEQVSDKDSEPAVESCNDSSASDAASDAPAIDEEHKDDVDPLAGLTLLSVIPASAQPIVVPADATTPETSTGDAVSVAPSAGQTPDDAATRRVTDTPAIAVAAAAVEAETPAEPAETAPKAVDGVDSKFSDELGAATEKPELAGKDEKDVAAAEPVEKKLEATAPASVPERLAQARVAVTEPATEAVAADVAEAAQVQAVTTAANPVAAAADSKTVAQPAEKTESAEGVQTAVDRSKERSSSRQSDTEPSTNQGGRENTQFSAVSLDSNPVAATHGSKGNESAPQQDVPLQVVTAASHSAKANDARNPELQASASLHAAASAASSTPHTPDTSWMSSVRLMERISQSEMRVGIQSELGDIAVRTAMNRHELSAEISVQHAGLRDAIAAEIPALQSRLSAQQIPMTNVSVTADAGGGANSFQQSAQDGRPASHYSAAANSNDSSVAEHDPVVPSEVLGRSAGLDIRI